MNASHVGLLAVSMLVAVSVRPAASDSCREEDLDAQGDDRHVAYVPWRQLVRGLARPSYPPARLGGHVAQ